MRSTRAYLIAGLAASLLVHSVSAGPVSPEASSLLKRLRDKLHGIEALSWTAEYEYGSTVNGYYRRGGTVRIDRTFWGTGQRLCELATPDGVCRLYPSVGYVDRARDHSLFTFTKDLWFLLPLLDEKLLADLGSLEVEAGGPPDQNGAVLVLTLERFPTYFGGVLRFYFDGGLVLKRVRCARGRHGTGSYQVMGYRRVGKYDFPAQVKAGWSGYSPGSSFELKEIEVNPSLNDALFTLDRGPVLTLYQDLDESEIRERLEQNPGPKERASLHYSLRQVYAKQQNPPAALTEARKALELCPEAKAAHFALAHALRSTQQWDEAAKVLEAMLVAFPDAADQVYERLVSHYRMRDWYPGQRELAAKWAREWTAKRPGSCTAWAKLAGVREANGELGAAAAAYEKMLGAADPVGLRTVDYQLRLAKIYQRLEEHDRAQKLLRAIVAIDAANVARERKDAKRELVNSYRATGRLDEALVKALEDHRNSPRDHVPLAMLVSLCLAKGQSEEAVQYLEKLVDLRPDDPSLYQDELHDHSIPAQARLRVWQGLMARAPDVVLHFSGTLFRLYRHEGSADKADQFARDLLAENPNDVQALGVVAGHYQQTGKLAEAVPLYEKLVRLAADPSTSHTNHLLLIRAYERTGQLEKAKEVALASLADCEDESRREQIAQALVSILKASGETASLVGGLEKRVQSEPKDLEALKLLAALKGAQKSHAEAADLWERIVRLDPQEGRYQAWTGALDRARRHEDLIAACHEFSEKFPRQASNNVTFLIRAYRATKQLDEAIKVVQDFARKRPGDTHVRTTLAQSLTGTGRLDEAIALYQQVARSAESPRRQWSARKEIAQLLIRQGKHEAAEPIARELADSAPPGSRSGEANRILVNVLQETGGLEAWIQELEEKIRTDAKDRKALTRLAAAMKARGDYSRAADLYGEAARSAHQFSDYSSWFDALTRARRDEDLLAAYGALFRSSPQHKMSYFSAGYLAALQRAGRVDDAVKEALAYTSQNPGSIHSLRQFAYSLVNAKQYAQAIAIHEQMVKLEENRDNRWSWRSRIAGLLLKQAKHTEAEKLARELIESAVGSHQRGEANRLLFRSLKESRRLESSVKELERKLEAAPEDVAALRQLAEFAYSARQFDRAADLYGRLVRTEHDPGIYPQWTAALNNAERHDDLCAAYEELVKRHPDERAKYRSSLIDAYEQAGRHDQALAIAREHARSDPQGGRAWSQLAELLKKRGKHDEAAEAFRKALGLCRDRETSWLWRKGLFESYRQQRRFAEAETTLQELIETAPHEREREEANALLVDLLQRMGKLASALDALEQKAAASPKDEAVLRQAAEFHLARKDYPKGAEYARKLVSLRPTKENYTRLLGALDRARDHSGRVLAYEDYFRKHPSEKRRHLMDLAAACQAAGKADRGIQAAQEHAKLNSTSAHSLARSADLLEQFGRLDEAVVLYQDAIKIDRSGHSERQWKHKIAQLYERQKKFPEAEAIARELLASAPDTYRRQAATKLLLSVLRHSGKEADSIAQLEKKVADNPEDRAALQQLIAIHKSENRHDRVSALSGKLVALDPSSASYSQWAYSLGRAGKHAEQAKAFEAYFAKFPDQKRHSGMALANAYRSAGQPEKAIQAGREYVKLRPRDGHTAGQLAQMLVTMDRLEDAAEAYRQAIEQTRHEQNRWERKYRLAGVLRSLKKGAEVEALVRELTRTARTDYQQRRVNALLVGTLKDLGKIDSVVQDLEGKYAANPQDRESLRQLARIYEGKGDHRKASEAYGQLVRVEPTKRNYDQWALALSKVGKNAELVDALGEFAAKFPEERPRLLQRLMYACKSLGRNDEAVKVARECAKLDPKGGRAMARLADLLMQLNCNGEALTAYQEAVRLADNEGAACQWNLKAAQIHRAEGRLKEAEGLARELIRTAPAGHYAQQAQTLLSEILKSSGDRARKMLERPERQPETDGK